MKLRALALLAIAVLVAGLAFQMSPAQSAAPTDNEPTPTTYTSYLGGATAHLTSDHGCTAPATAC